MSKSFSMIAASVSTTALRAMVLLNGSTSANAQGLFASERECAADVGSLCAVYGWSQTTDAGTAPQSAALIGAASTIAVTLLTTSRASLPAPSAARAVSWAGAIFLYLIAINYISGAILIAANWNGADEDFGAVALPVVVGGIFTVASIWATGRILVRWPGSASHADRRSSALIQTEPLSVAGEFWRALPSPSQPARSTAASPVSAISGHSITTRRRVLSRSSRVGIAVASLPAEAGTVAMRVGDDCVRGGASRIDLKIASGGIEPTVGRNDEVQG
jgi:hypothetical protein